MVDRFPQYVEKVRKGAACRMVKKEELQAYGDRPYKGRLCFKKPRQYGHSCPPDREVQWGFEERS